MGNKVEWRNVLFYVGVIFIVLGIVFILQFSYVSEISIIDCPISEPDCWKKNDDIKTLLNERFERRLRFGLDTVIGIFAIITGLLALKISSRQDKRAQQQFELEIQKLKLEIEQLKKQTKVRSKR